VSARRARRLAASTALLIDSTLVRTYRFAAYWTSNMRHLGAEPVFAEAAANLLSGAVGPLDKSRNLAARNMRLRSK